MVNIKLPKKYTILFNLVFAIKLGQLLSENSTNKIYLPIVNFSSTVNNVPDGF